MILSRPQLTVDFDALPGRFDALPTAEFGKSRKVRARGVTAWGGFQACGSFHLLLCFCANDIRFRAT
jgi:hypothetical protein